MADFVQNSQTKSAIRELADPIADVATFNTIVQSVITGNPFACVSYMTAGVTHDPVEKTKESYAVKIIYQDSDAKVVGNLSDKFSTIAGFNAGATAILADAALTTAHGGPPVRDTENETFSATLKCHDPNGELYQVNFSRGRVTLTSYSDEAIRTITDRKRAEEAFKETNKKLNLLSSITRHDINNQLTVLLGYLDIIEEQQPNPTLHEYCQKASGAAKRITTMIQFTKTYESIGVNEPTWQDTHALIETAVKDIALGKIQVVNDLPPGTEIYADPLIVKVFFNLMDNATKYGGEGMTTTRFSSGKSDSGLVILCEDDGAGISVEDKKRLFERGFGKNTGLGLFLSREILAITGIIINETSEQGKGARFEMAVPKGAWRMAGTDADDVQGRKP